MLNIETAEDGVIVFWNLQLSLCSTWKGFLCSSNHIIQDVMGSRHLLLCSP